MLERLAQAKDAVDALGPTVPDVEYFPVSARTGEGVEALVAHLVGRLDEGPPFFPDDVVTDTPEAWVAELVREQLLAKTRDELPHAITCRVTEWEWPHIRVEIIVERDSQKAIVIGKGGEVLKAVGIAVREAAARGDLPRPAREGGAALAEPRRDARPPRLLRPLDGLLVERPPQERPRPRQRSTERRMGGSVESNTPRYDAVASRGSSTATTPRSSAVRMSRPRPAPAWWPPGAGRPAGRPARRPGRAGPGAGGRRGGGRAAGRW